MCVGQVDNKGNHLLVHEESSINVPAIAAAHVIKRYIAQASDELSFEVTVGRGNWFLMGASWTHRITAGFICPLLPVDTDGQQRPIHSLPDNTAKVFTPWS